MKNIFLILFLLISTICESQTPSAIITVPDTNSLHTFNGYADVIYANATNQWYKLCSVCLTDSIIGAGGKKWRRTAGSSGGGGSPAGNAGNIQLNRSSAFATPASDSLSFDGTNGLTVKNNIDALKLGHDFGSFSNGREYLNFKSTSSLSFFKVAETNAHANAVSLNLGYSEGAISTTNGVGPIYFEKGGYASPVVISKGGISIPTFGGTGYWFPNTDPSILDVSPTALIAYANSTDAPISRFGITTIAGSAPGRTLTNPATLQIDGAPIAGTNATFTNTYSLWVKGGTSKFDGNIVMPATTSTAGVIYSGSNLFLHNSGQNTFVGLGSGNLTVDNDVRNTGIGKNTLSLVSSGYQNQAIGQGALHSLTTGHDNVAIGYNTLTNATTGYANIAIGGGVMASLTTGANLIGIGYNAMSAVTSGTSNLALGYNANPTVTSGSENVMIGDNAGNGVTTGNNNTSVGAESMKGGNGSNNTNVGYLAMNRVTSATYNTGVGMYNFYELSSGTQNTALGYQAGAPYDITGYNGVNTGSYNTALGANSGMGGASQWNYTTAIGYGALASASNAMVLGAESGTTGAVRVGIGVPVPLAKLHLPAGTASASSAPLKFTTASSVILTTPETGVMEVDTSKIYYSSGIGANLKRNEIIKGTYGQATLSGGTVTVSTSAVKATSIILLTDQTTGALTNVGSPTVGTIVAGASFVINSTNVLDASNVNYLIINP